MRVVRHMHLPVVRKIKHSNFTDRNLKSPKTEYRNPPIFLTSDFAFNIYPKYETQTKLVLRLAPMTITTHHKAVHNIK